MDESDDYKVGYKNPPKHSRFQKGKSGNPGGRQSGHRGLKTDLEETLNKKTTIQNKLTGKAEKARQQQHAIDRLVERASLGDLKAITLLLPTIMQVLGVEDRGKGPRRMPAQDAEILAEVLRSRLPELVELDVPLEEQNGDGNVAGGKPETKSSDDGSGGEEREGDEA